jgi:hypothetical protein
VLVAHCLRICLVQSAKKNWKNNQTAKKKRRRRNRLHRRYLCAPLFNRNLGAELFVQVGGTFFCRFFVFSWNFEKKEEEEEKEDNVGVRLFLYFSFFLNKFSSSTIWSPKSPAPMGFWATFWWKCPSSWPQQSEGSNTKWKFDAPCQWLPVSKLDLNCSSWSFKFRFPRGSWWVLMWRFHRTVANFYFYLVCGIE